MATDLKNTLKGKADEAKGAPAPTEERKPISIGAAFAGLVNSTKVKTLFEQTLKEKASYFVTSLISLFNADETLQKCDHIALINCASKAASLDLPIDKTLGYIWIVAYKNYKESQRQGRDVYEPSVQLGYKGYIQLALRTGQYEYLNAIPIYEGELVSWNRLTEKLVLDLDGKKSDAVIGYAGYFELVNGFKKTVYWTKDQIIAHKTRFSKQKGGTWESDFDAMAIKTVLRNMLSKWGILSIEMQQAYSDEVNDEVKANKEVPQIEEQAAPASVDAPFVDVEHTEVQ